MKTTVLSVLVVIFFFGFSYDVIAQEKGLELSHKKGKRVKFLKENRRVKVFTEDGNKYKGRFTIIDNETIEIKGNRINIGDIEVIRKKDLGVSILKGTALGFGSFLIVVGLASTGGGLGATLVATSGVFVNIITLAIPEIAIGELDNDRWSYSIIN